MPADKLWIPLNTASNFVYIYFLCFFFPTKCLAWVFRDIICFALVYDECGHSIWITIYVFIEVGCFPSSGKTREQYLSNSAANAFFTFASQLQLVSSWVPISGRRLSFQYYLHNFQILVPVHSETAVTANTAVHSKNITFARSCRSEIWGNLSLRVREHPLLMLSPCVCWGTFVVFV